MRTIGMDIHRSFAQVAILEDGAITRQLRVELVHEPLVAFAKTLSLDDEVVIEVTGNSAAVVHHRLRRAEQPVVRVRALDAHAGRVAGDDLSLAQQRNSRVTSGSEAALRAAEQVHQPALTERQAKQDGRRSSPGCGPRDRIWRRRAWTAQL